MNDVQFAQSVFAQIGPKTVFFPFGPHRGFVIPAGDAQSRLLRAYKIAWRFAWVLFGLTILGLKYLNLPRDIVLCLVGVVGNGIYAYFMLRLVAGMPQLPLMLSFRVFASTRKLAAVLSSLCLGLIALGSGCLLLRMQLAFAGATLAAVCYAALLVRRMGGKPSEVAIPD